MDCAHAALSLLLLVPCEDGSGTDMNLAVAEALASPDRIEDDRRNDPLKATTPRWPC